MTFGRAYCTTLKAALSDFGALLLLVMAGIAYSFFYPLPYQPEQVQQVPVMVVDLDHSSASRQLTRFALAHPQLLVQQVTGELAEAQDALWRGAIDGVLIIPKDLRKNLLAGRRTSVQLVGNGAYFLLNRTVLSGLAEAAGTLSAGIDIRRLEAKGQSGAQAAQTRAPLQFLSRPLFNVSEGYGSYVVPAVSILIVQQTLLIGMGLLFGSWAESGYRSAPATRGFGAYLGMLAAFASIAFVNCLYFFGFVFWFQDYPRGGNLGGMLLFAALFCCMVAACGALIGSFFKEREQALAVLLFTALPMLFLTGFSWPLEALPWPLSWLRLALPSTPGIQGLLALNQMGASLHEVRTELAHCTALLAIALAIGYARWRVLARR